MAEVSRRDRKAGKLHQLYAEIDVNVNQAPRERKAKLDTIWTEYERLHQLVMIRAGAEEIGEQEAFYDGVHEAFDAASVILEGGRNAMAQPADTLNDQHNTVNIQLQRRYQAVIQRFLNACDRIKNTIEAMQEVEITIERANIEQIYQSLQDISLNQVGQVNDEVNFLENEERTAAIFCDTMRILITAQAPLITAPQVMQPVAAVFGADSLKISNLHITPFDGQFDKWESFRESFMNGIHNRERMPAVQKLQYLKSVLRSEPEELVRNFGLTAENYELAWLLLNERYNNRRELVASHLRILTSLPACEESADDLRRLSSKTASSLLALRNLGRNIDEWNDWIIFYVCEKLDKKHDVCGNNSSHWETFFQLGRI